jgi:Tfp pilus assembly protein PilF
VGSRRARPTVALALALLCPGATATIERNPLERRLTVKPALLLFLLLLVAGTSPAADKHSRQEVKFGIEVAQQGMWREALFRFERAVELDPQNPSALNNLAVALEQMGDFQEARKYYERALELKPDDLYIQQNYDLFREADDKRNRKRRRRRR